VDECVLSGFDDPNAKLLWKSLADSDRTAQCVAHGSSSLRRHGRDVRTGHRAAVHRRPDAAEDRYAESPAELRAGFRHGRSRSRAFRRRGAHRHVGGQREHGRETQREQN
jgi:hypothetical protein